MNRIIALLSAAFAIGGLGFGQIADSSEKPPLPPGPILKRFPAMAKWQITFVYSNDQKPAAAGPTSSREGTPSSGVGMMFPPRKIVVTKTGPVWTATCEDVKGRRVEQWSPGFGRFVKFPGEKPVSLPEVEQMETGSPSNDIPSFNSADFPGLEWLSPNFYVGVEKTQARSFYVFRDPEKNLTAWVDVETQLPIRLRRGDEVITLQILPPPTEPLRIPVDFQKVIDRIKRAREMLGIPSSQS